MIAKKGVAVLAGMCVVGTSLLDQAIASGRHANTARSNHGSCGSFCRQAGGLGGKDSKAAPCRVLSSRILPTDGVAPVSVRCRGSRTSRGALVIFPHYFHDYVWDGIPKGSYDGVDLLARPGRTVTVRILLSRDAQALLRRKRRLLVDVLVELNTIPPRHHERTRIPLLLARSGRG